jgi:hypothetical protein
VEPLVSYIVSALDRPDLLRCCLASILTQSAQACDIIVTDNATSPLMKLMNQRVSSFDSRILYLNTQAATCYHSAEIGAAQAIGKYLCFPSDDSYYVPCFQELMVQEAESRDLQLVYCDMLFDGRRMGGKYGVLNVQPQLNHIDKTGFLVRRDVFDGFKEKDSSSAADGYFIEEMLSRGIRHGKLSDVLAVHN